MNFKLPEDDSPVMAGTTGYAAIVQKFTEATLAIAFEDLHKDFLPFLLRNPHGYSTLGQE